MLNISYGNIIFIVMGFCRVQPLSMGVPLLASIGAGLHSVMVIYFMFPLSLLLTYHRQYFNDMAKKHFIMQDVTFSQLSLSSF